MMYASQKKASVWWLLDYWWFFYFLHLFKLTPFLLTVTTEGEKETYLSFVEIFSSVSRRHRWTLRSWTSSCTAPGKELKQKNKRTSCLRYDKRDSPPVDLPIPVKIGITLLSLQSPDESSLVSSNF